MREADEYGPGMVIAQRYRLDHELGRGGMGAVFAATQLGLERQVAVKVIDPGLSSRPEARIRFEREARVAAALKHPNAVEIYDFGDDDGNLFPVMERLEGAPLGELVDDESSVMTPEHAIAVAAQVADVLATAHAATLVHRDVKPDNIFLEQPDAVDGRVLLLDFGLAFMAQSDDATGRMTAEGIMSGTPLYVSPEQARGDATVGPPTDVYALGCVLFEMLTGLPPFEGNQVSLLAQHCFKQPPLLKDVSPDPFPNRLQLLITAMMDKDAAGRPPAEQVVRQLRAIDPRVSERLGKGRLGPDMVGREARMISLPPGVDPNAATQAMEAQALQPSPLAQGSGHAIGVAGSLDETTRLALAMAGFRLVPLDLAAGEQLSLLVVLGATLAEVAELVAGELPVLADASPEDFDRFQALLECGAAEVLMQPLKPERTVHQIERVLKARK